MYISQFIDNYEVSNKVSGTGRVSVRDMCHRSLRKKERPHNLRIVLEDSSPVQLYETVCSCAAGKALCNHTVALLFQTATYSQLRLLAVPPVLSCTETEQRWHKPKTMVVKPGRVSDMVVMSAKPKQRTVASGVGSPLYKAMRGDMPDVLKVTEAYKGFSPDIAPLITTMSISANVPLVESALGKVQEGSLISYQCQQAASFHSTLELLHHHHCLWMATDWSPLVASLYAVSTSNCICNLY
ncbi:uncharacterized protein LOC114572580 isoform X2 [Perca flavescens]|uniref:uncharacterized protein LOC114572580 isoform X2 n=1 Tax=Perca flavescens TaxID=8167 RepID=UPI00106EAEE9|nr:uncharacterized protein LOC114572580 isoform X2 [Perca flavescens]